MWNDDLFSEAQPLVGKLRAHMVAAAVSIIFNAAKSGVGLFLPRCSTREIPILSDELQLKMQLLVHKSFDGSMRLNDEIVMTPEMNFSKARKRNSEMDGGR